MSEGPDIARVAALVADPARSAMLMGLMDGRALTATELAGLAGVTRQTASSHLSRLVDGAVVVVAAAGRHRYFRLAGPHVAGLLEALMVFSGDAVPPLRTGPRDPALRKARVCYDHLAGATGVLVHDRALARGWIAPGADAVLGVTGAGWERLAVLGIREAALAGGRRPLCRACLDWSERRPHLAGLLGQAVLDRILALSWARRQPGSRVVSFSPDGERRLRDWLG